MDDTCIYRITIRGQVDPEDINAMSPTHVVVAQVDSAAASITVRTDQSGLVGLIRHLHGRGFVLLSVVRKS
jgi:hypothetical protein